MEFDARQLALKELEAAGVLNDQLTADQIRAEDALRAAITQTKHPLVLSIGYSPQDHLAAAANLEETKRRLKSAVSPYKPLITALRHVAREEGNRIEFSPNSDSQVLHMVNLTLEDRQKSRPETLSITTRLNSKTPLQRIMRGRPILNQLDITFAHGDITQVRIDLPYGFMGNLMDKGHERFLAATQIMDGLFKFVPYGEFDSFMRYRVAFKIGTPTPEVELTYSRWQLINPFLLAINPNPHRTFTNILIYNPHANKFEKKEKRLPVLRKLLEIGADLPIFGQLEPDYLVILSPESITPRLGAALSFLPNLAIPTPG